MFSNIWMLHNFWLAKPYGLADQQLYYIQIYKIAEKDKEWSWEWLVNTGPVHSFYTEVPCPRTSMFVLCQSIRNVSLSLKLQ